MKISQQQIINPGIFDQDEKYHKQLRRFERAVERAHFLNDEEKNHWYALGCIMSTEQLLEAERLIINEDLKKLQTRQKLEKLKSKPESK